MFHKYFGILTINSSYLLDVKQSTDANIVIKLASVILFDIHHADHIIDIIGMCSTHSMHITKQQFLWYIWNAKCICMNVNIRFIPRRWSLPSWYTRSIIMLIAQEDQMLGFLNVTSNYYSYETIWCDIILWCMKEKCT